MSEADADYKRSENNDSVPIVRDNAKVENGLDKNPDSDEALGAYPPFTSPSLLSAPIPMT